MDEEFIYCRHRTPVGVKVEEVSGGAGRSPKVWRALAMQVWKENGHDEYRDIDHLECGAPLLWDSHSRISLTHTAGLLVVATLPPTPECDLSTWYERTALGVDAERADRVQALKVRERFLNEAELPLVAADDVEAHVLAWTCKEALYKAALTPGLDWHRDVTITALPHPDDALGAARVRMPHGEQDFLLCSYRCGEYLVTIAITPRTATYLKDKKDKGPDNKPAR